MINRSALLALMFACFPMFASANIISLEYTGHVTTLFGNGNGYSYGDSVNGKFTVDFSKATYVDSNGSDTARYQASVSKGLVTGAVDTTEEGWNIVDVYNGSHQNWFGEFEDFFQVLESRPSSSLPGWIDGFQLTLTLNGFDWLRDLTLSNSHIIANDFNTLGFSFGALSQVLSSVDADGNPAFEQNTAIFGVDSLKLVSTDVPEASSIILMLIGCLSLVIRAKRT